MPSRSSPVGNSVGSLTAMLGAVTTVDLTATGVSAGTAADGYKMPTDVVVVTKADASNTAVTLPDPYLQGWTAGDYYEIVNGTSQALVVFPPVGGAINAVGSRGSVALPAATTTQNAAGRYYITVVASGASKFTFTAG